MRGRRRLSNRIAVAVAISTAAALAAAPGAHATVSGTNVAGTVAGAIGSPSGSAFVFSPGADPGLNQAGLGDNVPPLAGFPTAGNTFGVLTSGDARLADDANTNGSSGAPIGIQDPARGDANDSQTLRIDFTVPGGSNCVNIDYRFFSEEFPEFVNLGFNDGFVAELDATSWRTENQKINAPLDFAAGYGDQVAVDTVGPTIVEAANAAGTTYDAATKTLTAKEVATPGPHSVYLSIFDAGDSIFDSAVFLDNLRFTNEPPESCRPPDIFEGKVGAKLKGKLAVKGKNLLVPILCELPEGAIAPCVGSVTVTASGGGSSAAAAKKQTVAKGSYSVEPGQKGKAKAKLTKAGKRLAKAKGKIKVKVKVTNTVNGASQTFKAKL